MTDLGLAGFACCVVSVGDTAAAGGRDQSGDIAVEMLKAAGATTVAKEVVSDDVERIISMMNELSSSHHLIVTTGGTGVAPRDVTPEATAAVCEKLVPGIAELMRSVSLAKTPHAALSRALCGIHERALIVNLPGSPGGVRDCLAAVLPVLPHALGLINTEATEHLQT